MATKKFDRTVWHGTDSDKVTSLFEYGLLVRYITKEKSWQCIYRNPYEPNKFSYSWISEEDMREMFLTGWAKDDLKSFVPMSVILGMTGCFVRSLQEYMIWFPIMERKRYSETVTGLTQQKKFASVCI